MSQEFQKFLLPFAVPSSDKAFTEEMKMAAVFCLAELDRVNGKWRILRKPVRELLFISEVCYPIWLVPWERRCLVFDGFGIASYVFSYHVLPDVERFMNDAEGSADMREAYYATLSGHLNYFKGFVKEEEKRIEGLIAGQEFVHDFVFYLSEAYMIKKPILDKVLLSPLIDESSIFSFTSDLSNLKTIIKKDLNDLDKSMKLLSATEQRHVRAIDDEIKLIRKEYNEKLASVRSSAMEKLREIRKKYDQEIVMVSKRFEEQLQSLHQERAKLEKAVQSMILNIEHSEAEIKSCKLQRDEAGEFRWRGELEKCKKELLNLQKSVKDMDEKIRVVDASKKVEISKLTSEYDHQEEVAMAELGVLEASRDAKIQMRQQEIESLEDITATIIDQISKLVEIKERELDELGKLGIKRAQRKPAVVYLPLYLICYQTESKRSYVMYPPSIVMSIRISTKIRGFFGVSKIKSLLDYRSKPITNFLNQFMSVVERNPVFEKEMSNAGIGASILRTKVSKEKIRMGLKELKKEGWISEREFRVFTDTLMKA